MNASIPALSPVRYSGSDPAADETKFLTACMANVFGRPKERRRSFGNELVRKKQSEDEDLKTSSPSAHEVPDVGSGLVGWLIAGMPS